MLVRGKGRVQKRQGKRLTEYMCVCNAFLRCMYDESSSL